MNEWNFLLPQEKLRMGINTLGRIGRETHLHFYNPSFPKADPRYFPSYNFGVCKGNLVLQS